MTIRIPYTKQLVINGVEMVFRAGIYEDYEAVVATMNGYTQFSPFRFQGLDAEDGLPQIGVDTYDAAQEVKLREEILARQFERVTEVRA